MDHPCYLCILFAMMLRLFVAPLWSPAGKGLTSWLLCDVYCDFVTFPFGTLGQMWYFIASIADHSCLSQDTTLERNKNTIQ